jgi:hypothetical protein
VLKVAPIICNVPKMIELPDPIAIPTSGSGRVKLALVGFRESLPGNESLIRLRAIADGDARRSRLINMGTYGHEL